MEQPRSGERCRSPDAVGGPSSEAAPLTERELAVLRLVAEGGTDRQIAEALAIRQRTVEWHVSNLLRKLGVGSRTAAAAYAIRHGLD